jgi:hypothetical protein
MHVLGHQVDGVVIHMLFLLLPCAVTHTCIQGLSQRTSQLLYNSKTPAVLVMAIMTLGENNH